MPNRTGSAPEPETVAAEAEAAAVRIQSAVRGRKGRQEAAAAEAEKAEAEAAAAAAEVATRKQQAVGAFVLKYYLPRYFSTPEAEAEPEAAGKNRDALEIYMKQHQYAFFDKGKSKLPYFDQPRLQVAQNLWQLVLFSSPLVNHVAFPSGYILSKAEAAAAAAAAEAAAEAAAAEPEPEPEAEAEAAAAEPEPEPEAEAEAAAAEETARRTQGDFITKLLVALPADDYREVFKTTWLSFFGFPAHMQDITGLQQVLHEISIRDGGPGYAEPKDWASLKTKVDAIRSARPERWNSLEDWGAFNDHLAFKAQPNTDASSEVRTCFWF